jgi:hypothetical protein
MTWRASAVRLALIYICRDVPCPENAASYVKVRVVAGKIITANQTILRILFWSLLLLLVAVVSLDNSEKDVISARGLYLLSEEEKRE